MNALIAAGAVLVLLGVLGFAVPFISTEQTKNVATIGELKLQATEDKTYVIPPLASGGALVLGIALLGAGLYRKS
jgi:hypothetical protein